MKKRRHSSSILQFAANLASRESGFIFALVGVLVQASHTWFISFELSSFTGFLRLMQAGLMAFFLSAALLYFTLKSSDDDSDTARRYRKIVWWFALIECFINLYYWGYHLLVEPWPNADWSRFIIAVPFSILLPFTLKAYSSEVRTDDYSDEEDGSEPETVVQDISESEYKSLTNEILSEQKHHENDVLVEQKHHENEILHTEQRSVDSANDDQPIEGIRDSDGDEPEPEATEPEPEPGREQIQAVSSETSDTTATTDIQLVEAMVEPTEGLKEPEPTPIPEPAETPEPEPTPTPTPTPEPEPDLYKYRSQNNL